MIYMALCNNVENRVSNLKEFVLASLGRLLSDLVATMIKKFAAITLTVLLITFTQSCDEKYTGPPADLVIKNAKIITIDKDNPRAEAVAIIGEEIIAVSSNKNID